MKRMENVKKFGFQGFSEQQNNGGADENA